MVKGSRPDPDQSASLRSVWARRVAISQVDAFVVRPPTKMCLFPQNRRLFILKVKIVFFVAEIWIKKK